MSNQKILALCGIIGPILYLTVITVLGSLYPGYDHLSDVMSKLGATGAPNAIIMNVFGFGLLGLTLIAFAFGLYMIVKSRISLALMIISGLGIMMAGVFQCEPGCVGSSFNAMMHNISAGIPAFGMGFAMLFLALRFRKDRKWKNYSLYTLATGILIAFFGLSFLFSDFQGFEGAIQRMTIIAPLIWIELVAIRIFRTTS